jgi:hypothetical protein
MLSEQVSKYISSEGFDILYPLLMFQIQICEARGILINDTCTRFREYYTEADNGLSTSNSIIKLQATQLDVISKLCMFVEDFLGFSRYLRICKKELPNKIQSQENKVWNEIRSLQKMKTDGFRKYLILPSARQLAISEIEQKFVKQVLKIILSGVQERIQRIIKFYIDFHRVYNKYKHIFAGQLGTYSIENNIRKPRIFIRDAYDYPKGVFQKKTYVLPTDTETIDYFEKIKDDILTVFLTLLESHIHSIQNCGKPFLIPDGFFLSQDTKLNWLHLVRRINLVTGIQPLKMRINVKHNIKQTMLDSLSKNHIFIIDKDIFDHPENILQID